MIVKMALSEGHKRLLAAGISEAQVECEHMLMQLLNLNRSEIYLFSGQSLQSEQTKLFFSWIEQREKRIPLAYLLGDVFFYSLKLKVRPGCLIPRPETELLVEKAAKIFRAAGMKSPFFMDLGTGSGAIACALLGLFPKAQAVCVDVSVQALEIARENLVGLGLFNRAQMVESDLFFNLPSGKKYDAILSNPPYLSREDMNVLQPELGYEPILALDGGEDGLNFYRRIISDAENYLKPQGVLGFEVGAGQAITICNELKKKNYEKPQIFCDDQGVERVVFAKLS